MTVGGAVAAVGVNDGHQAHGLVQKVKQALNQRRSFFIRRHRAIINVLRVITARNRSA